MATSKGYSKLSNDNLSLDEMDKSCDAPGESGGSPRPSAEGNATKSESSNWLKIIKDVFLSNHTKLIVIVITLIIIGVLVLTASVTWLVCERQQDHDRISRQNNKISQLYDRMSQLHDQLQIVSARQCNCNYTSVMDGYEIEKEDNQVRNNSARITSLGQVLENETQSRKNDHVQLTELVSKLTDRVVLNEERSHELEMNMSHLQKTFLEQVQNLTSLQENLDSDFSESLARSVSALNTSIQGVNEKLFETNSRLSNLSSSHEDLRAEHATVTTVKVAALQRNVSLLNHYIRTMEVNHSSVLTEHSRALSAVERNMSVLTQRISNTSQALQTQGERMATIESRLSGLGSDITSVRSTLSSKIDNKASDLGTRIDDHITQVNDKFDGIQASNAASIDMPLGCLSLTFIFGFINFVIG